MNRTALILLEDDLDAMRLLATWPIAGRSIEAGELADLALDDAVIEQWSMISNVDVTDVTRLLPMLVQNEMIMPLGEVDEDAETYIRARVAVGAKRK